MGKIESYFYAERDGEDVEVRIVGTFNGGQTGRFHPVDFACEDIPEHIEDLEATVEVDGEEPTPFELTEEERTAAEQQLLDEMRDEVDAARDHFADDDDVDDYDSDGGPGRWD